MGKKVIFLTECHSTNDELANLFKKEDIPEGTTIITNHQKEGRGQRGNAWFDEPGKNLLISVLLKPSYLLITQQYLLNVAVGLGVLKCASRYLKSSQLQLKWPNDLLVDGRKISGILIENSIKGRKMESCIAGIGFNLNQKAFNLPSATSLILETNKSTDRDEFAERLFLDLEYYLIKLMNHQDDELIKIYHENLFLNGNLGDFKDKDGEFTGRLMGIDSSGRLKVQKNGIIITYGLKEIEFLM